MIMFRLEVGAAAEVGAEDEAHPCLRFMRISSSSLRKSLGSKEGMCLILRLRYEVVKSLKLTIEIIFLLVFPCLHILFWMAD
jgi:hypothetical protein